MKKVISFASASLAYLLATGHVMANHAIGHIEIDRPQVESQGVLRDVGFSTVGDAIEKILTLAFIVAVILVLIMLIWGAMEWIMSGGEKDSVGKARGKILNALIGLAVLAVAFAIYVLAGQFLGFSVRDFTIPSPAP